MDTESSVSLSERKIQDLPSSFYYIPNFLSPAECDALLQKIPSRRWTQVSGRRVQAHPSTLAKGDILISAPLPDWLNSPILERFENFGIFVGTKHGGPNHVLVNEYLPGDGIMPHEDGTAVYSPVVATVSLGGSIVLDVKEKTSNDAAKNEEEINQQELKSWRILQEPGSLLVTIGEAYSSLLHGISYITEDVGLSQETVANWSLLGDTKAFTGGVNQRTTRISLTYRDVLKVTKVGGFLGGRR